MEQQINNSNNPVSWFEIYVDNLSRAQKFYETVLDVEMQDLPDPNNRASKMKAFPMKMDAPNASGSLVEMEGMKAGGNGTIVYFESADCDKEEARVENAGGKVYKKKMNIGKHGFMSLCTDTEGNMFGLLSMK
jgi:uncharacterized protein